MTREHNDERDDGTLLGRNEPAEATAAAAPRNGSSAGSVATATSTISADDAGSTGSVADGEIEILLQALEEEPSVLPLAPSVDAELKRSLSGVLSSTSGESYYGLPLSPEEAARRVPEIVEAENEEEPTTEKDPAARRQRVQGLQWHALVIPDIFFSDGKLVRGLNKRDFDAETQQIKPRRPSLPLTATNLFGSLTKIESKITGSPRYIFHGVLNGWPALRCFELLSLEQRRQTAANMVPSFKEILSGQIVWMHHWKASEEGARGVAPSIEDQRCIYRATLRAAPWTGRGWSKSSPGFAWWYEPHRPLSQPHVSYGSNMMQQLGDDAKCTHVHMLSHRYAVHKESARDLLTYHSVCVLEWEHGNFCTVVECAYLNGLGGYKGRSNWYEDRDEDICGLYKAFPPEMILPWRMTQAEIRCFDVPFPNVESFASFVQKYQGKDGRFVDPQFTFSHPARLTFRSKKHIAQYLLNYIQRDSTYADLKRNCQTFAADFCAFVAGKRNVAPFHPVSRIEYTNRTHLFMYDPHLYESREEKQQKKKQQQQSATTPTHRALTLRMGKSTSSPPSPQAQLSHPLSPLSSLMGSTISAASAKSEQNGHNS